MTLDPEVGVESLPRSSAIHVDLQSSLRKAAGSAECSVTDLVAAHSRRGGRHRSQPCGVGLWRHHESRGCQAEVGESADPGPLRSCRGSGWSSQVPLPGADDRGVPEGPDRFLHTSATPPPHGALFVHAHHQRSGCAEPPAMDWKKDTAGGLRGEQLRRFFLPGSSTCDHRAPA